MTTRSFKAALLEADSELINDAQLRAMHARLDARLFTPKRPSRALAFAVVFASAVLGFVTVRSLAPTLPEVVGGFEVKPVPETHAQVTREAMVELTADATVVDTARGVTIHSLTRSTVRREARGIRLLEGKASFDVVKRSGGVVRVLVSGGSIEVHGTRFTVFDDGRGAGSVELHEGVIEFIDEGGASRRLAPGDVLRWPREPEAPYAPEEEEELFPLSPIRPPPRKPSPSSKAVDWRAFDQRVHAQAVITELSSLRQKGQWTDAVRLLERELNRGAPDTRERLSFELGLLYTWQLKDTASACAHWVQHQREYAEGRFDVEIARARVQLGCAP